jgi:hypothetical protein
MKKLSICLLILVTSIYSSYTQNITITDGLIVGNSTLTIPSGSPYKMVVAGGILTEKVRVATNGTPFWADFVFEPNYKLRSLPELEQFIKQNKHLPDIPTTKEVTEKGIDLAETQALLLQKIEELSLYVIQQGKEIERLKRKVGNLKKK